MGMNHDAHHQARLVRPVAPGMVDALYDDCVASFQERLVCISHQINLTRHDDAEIAGVCTVHGGMTRLILISQLVLLLQLFFHFLHKREVLLWVLGVMLHSFHHAIKQALA